MKLKTLTSDAQQISLTGEVNDSMTKVLDDGLVKAREDNKKKVVILLSSRGGSVDSGNAIAETIRLASRNGLDISIVGRTYVRSAAVVIFMSLPVEKRFITRDCHIMVHPVKKALNKLESPVSITELIERLNEELGHAKHIQRVENAMIRKIRKEAGISEERFEQMYRTSHRFYANDVIKHNLASAIIR